MGPTPWVSTSQPAAVSMGDPQLPSWMTSHEAVGVWHATCSSHRYGFRVYEMVLDSRSLRERAANRPPIWRGKRASPLLAAAAPTIGEDVKLRKSCVSSSCWPMSVPLYAV